jgi:hypothetical protein
VFGERFGVVENSRNSFVWYECDPRESVAHSLFGLSATVVVNIGEF